MMNKVELMNGELNMVNGGSETVVIDLSKYRDCPSLGPVPQGHSGDKSLREILLEQQTVTRFD